MEKICIIGQDRRSEELRQLYKSEGYILEHYSKSNIVIAPIPLTRDNIYVTSENIKLDELIFSMKKSKAKLLISGSITSQIKEKLTNNGIYFLDLLENESLAKKNAMATAEGTLKIIMDNIETTIKDCNIAITGYGRISKYLSNILKALGANVTVFVRKEEVEKQIKKDGFISESISNLESISKGYDVIINTVPAIIFKKEVLKKIDKKTLIIDVASNLGGIDYKEAEKLNLNTIWALSIPSKYCPISAAKYLKEEIDKVIL